MYGTIIKNSASLLFIQIQIQAMRSILPELWAKPVPSKSLVLLIVKTFRRLCNQHAGNLAHCTVWRQTLKSNIKPGSLDTQWNCCQHKFFQFNNLFLPKKVIMKIIGILALAFIYFIDFTRSGRRYRNEEIKYEFTIQGMSWKVDYIKPIFYNLRTCTRATVRYHLRFFVWIWHETKKRKSFFHYTMSSSDLPKILRTHSMME